jgi:hypothetical protein
MKKPLSAINEHVRAAVLQAARTPEAKQATAYP